MKRFFGWSAALLLVLIVGAIAWFWTPDRSAEAMHAQYGGETSRFVELANGQTVHLRDSGPRDAPVLLLLHGSNASLHTWEPWAQALSDEYRIIRFDQPGHGLTGPHVEGRYAAADFVDTVDRVADALDLDRFVLGGNSMGGGIALRYAIAHGERLDGLLLVDASGMPEARPDRTPIGFRLARMPVISDLMAKITPRSMIESSLRQSVTNQAIVDEAMIDRYYDLLLYPGNRAATIERFRTPRAPVSAQAAAAIAVPTLILWGADDALIPLRAGRWFDEHIPDSALIVYENIGHIPMEEAPERTAADVRRWLDTLHGRTVPEREASAAARLSS